MRSWPSSHGIGERERQPRQRDEQGQPEDVGDPERRDPPKDGSRRHVGNDAPQHEHVEPHRRGDEADLGHHHDDDAEPHRVVPEAHDQREENRHGQEQHGQRLEHAAEQEVDEEDEQHHRPRRDRIGRDERPEPLRQPGQIHEVREHPGADEHGEQRGGGEGGLAKHLERASDRQGSARERDEEGAHRSHPGRLGRGEREVERPHVERAVEPADDEKEQEEHGPDAAERPAPVRPGRPLSGRPGLRAAGHREADRGQVAQHAEQAGNDAGDEELADGGLGQQPVDDEDHRRRDQDPEGAPGRDRSGGQAVVVAEPAHLRHRHLRHRRGGGERRSADGGESGARADRRHREAAPEVAEEGVGGPVQLARETALVHEQPHQDEERNDGQAVVLRGVDDQPPDHRDGASVGVEMHVAEHPDETHRERDRHAEQDEGQHRREADQRFNHRPAGRGRARTPATTRAGSGRGR